MDLCEENGNDGVHEKQNGNSDGGVKQDFFHPTFGAEDVPISAECGTQTGTPLLQQDGCREEYGQSDLDGWKKILAHNH